jgi:hypothetical protein
MSFRVLITGPRHFTDYPALRAALDALLVNRLPDVELLTAGGRGVPMLAASYATERGLTVTARVADFARFPLDAVERRDAFLVNEADAAVVVWADRDPNVRRVLALVERKGIPVHVIGGPEKKPKARKARAGATEHARTSRLRQSHAAPLLAPVRPAGSSAGMITTFALLALSVAQPVGMPAPVPFDRITQAEAARLNGQKVTITFVPARPAYTWGEGKNLVPSRDRWTAATPSAPLCSRVTG